MLYPGQRPMTAPKKKKKEKGTWLRPQEPRGVLHGHNLPHMPLLITTKLMREPKEPNEGGRGEKGRGEERGTGRREEKEKTRNGELKKRDERIGNIDRIIWITENGEQRINNTHPSTRNRTKRSRPVTPLIAPDGPFLRLSYPCCL